MTSSPTTPTTPEIAINWSKINDISQKPKSIDDIIDEIGKNIVKVTIKKKEIQSIFEDDVHIQNIVSTCSLTTKHIDLKTISNNMVNIEYDPRKFAAAVFRLEDPKVTMLIFSTGKIVCTGPKSIKDVEKSLNRCVKILKKAGGYDDMKLETYKVQNVVGSVDYFNGCNTNKNFIVDLNRFSTCNTHEKYEVSAIYEPEIFPGLTLRIIGYHIAALIFTSGKIVITGGKTIEEVKQFYITIKSIVSIYVRAKRYNGGGDFEERVNKKVKKILDKDVTTQ